MRMRLGLLVLAMSSLAGVCSADPVAHGYGNRTCEAFLDSYKRADDGEDRGVFEYSGYEQWLAGLATGLSLATGEDALRGADIEGLMRRVKLRCEDDPKLDVLDAAMAQIKEMSVLR